MGTTTGGLTCLETTMHISVIAITLSKDGTEYISYWRNRRLNLEKNH
ncbi:hypothetical protein HanXRQr2_Chr04g0154631 [Helianthus annuus]|uniref:Uncharacterized protein n=1 Tax=Helianthus annuus TaxID=4232 RepID=A0A9K3NQU1_HELAN|nr:hypothetical protein HanXRQr2_Chr04g0154631 [Helianthus annuus]KAJ0587732.1 hypothetical protein HanIR_Chr04g0166541 [Helianthus annuus]